jgi:hypothetical protein
MKDAVSGFGAEISTAKILDTTLDTSQKGLGRYKTVENCITGFSPKLVSNELSGEVALKVAEKVGGGGRSRTYDAADMSRVL